MSGPVAGRSRGAPFPKSSPPAVLLTLSFVLASSEAERLCHGIFKRGEAHCSRVRFFHRKVTENAEYLSFTLFAALQLNNITFLIETETTISRKVELTLGL